MPNIALGNSSKRRRTTWMPDIRVINFLVEKDETNQFDGVSHIQRPGLVEFVDLGYQPVRGVFRQAGTLDGDFIAVAGPEAFRVKPDATFTSLADVSDTTDRVSIAATSSRVIIASGGLGVSTNGTDGGVPVVMPDAREIGSVAQLNGYFVLAQKDSARFYWIEPGQTNPDGLSFATTESTPGDIKVVVRVGDELWFLKEEGCEVWVPTGDADLPFQRVPGRNYDKGCRNGDTAVKYDNSLAWVGDDGIVYRADSSPVRISDHALEEQIRKSDPAELHAWAFAIDGHSLYCLTLPSGTYAYDAATQQWSEFRSYGRNTWLASIGDVGETFVLAGSEGSSKLYRLDAEVSTDDGTFMERILTGGVTVARGPERCDVVNLYIQTGTSQNPEAWPKGRLRWSDDLETWSDWETFPIGRTGQYGRPVEITRLGAMYYPGRMFELSFTDDCVVTVKAASYNEPVG